MSTIAIVSLSCRTARKFGRRVDLAAAIQPQGANSSSGALNQREASSNGPGMRLSADTLSRASTEIPAAGDFRDQDRGRGGLMSYGADVTDQFRRASKATIRRPCLMIETLA